MNRKIECECSGKVNVVLDCPRCGEAGKYRCPRCNGTGEQLVKKR